VSAVLDRLEGGPGLTADLRAENADLAGQLRRLTFANDSRKRIRSEIYEKAARYDDLIHALRFFEERAEFFKGVLVDIAGGSQDARKSAQFALAMYPE